METLSVLFEIFVVDEPGSLPVLHKVVAKPKYHLGFKIHHRAFSYKGIGKDI